MKIKRHLPCAPFPATKEYHDDRYIRLADGSVYRRKPSSFDTVYSIGQAVTEESKKNSHAAALAERERKWRIIRKMVKEGESLEAMMEATGYKSAESVYHALRVMRDAGEDIPERMKTCKKQ